LNKRVFEIYDFTAAEIATIKNDSVGAVETSEDE
jgi:hypothetical protein